MIWKRLAVLSVLLFGFCCFPVMAEESTDWPDMDTSSSYDYSKLVINPDSFKDATYNLTRSLKSYSNIGYQIMFILGGVMLIPKIFKMVTAHAEQLRKGVDRRSLNREIEAMDFDENRTEVINSKLLEKEVNLMSEQRFRAKNWESLVENGVHKKELARAIEKENISRNRADIVAVGVVRKEISRTVYESDVDIDRSDIVVNGQIRKDISDSTNSLYQSTHSPETGKSGSIHRKSDTYKSANRAYYEKRQAEMNQHD